MTGGIKANFSIWVGLGRPHFKSSCYWIVFRWRLFIGKSWGFKSNFDECVHCREQITQKQATNTPQKYHFYMCWFFCRRLNGLCFWGHSCPAWGCQLRVCWVITELLGGDFNEVATMKGLDMRRVQCPAFVVSSLSFYVFIFISFVLFCVSFLWSVAAPLCIKPLEPWPPKNNGKIQDKTVWILQIYVNSVHFWVVLE